MSLPKNYYDITEEEAIKISIELGENGSEFNTSSWKNRGCLKPDNTLEAFIKKLKRYFVNVEHNELKGKKRRYRLIGLRNTPLEKDDNRNGKKMIEKEILLPYMFKKLSYLASEGKYETTKKELAKKIFFLGENQEKKVTFVNELFSVLKNTDVPKVKVRGISYKLWETYELNIINTVNTILDTLKEGRFISVTDVYKARYVSEGGEKDYTYYTLNQLKIDELKELEQQIVLSLGMKYEAYQKYFILSQVPNDILDIRKIVSEALKEKLSIESYYKAIKIEILDECSSSECLSNSEIALVCLERFSRLLTKKVNKHSYKNGLSYDKKFHYLAHLVFMKVMNPLENYEALIEKELEFVDKKVDQLKEHYRKIFTEERLISEPSEYDLIMSDYYAELVEQGEGNELDLGHITKPLGFGHREESNVPL